MIAGLLGTKVGMTRLFDEDGITIAVTVIQLLENRIVALKTPDRDGYSAVQLTTGDKKVHKLTAAQRGHYASALTKAVGAADDTALADFVGDRLKEFRVDDVQTFNIGDKWTVGHFADVGYVDITGVTKGKGFQGGIKRHHFHRQDMTHGNSLSHRVPGSIGQNQSPGRVFKGKKMPGHMGAVKRTAVSLKVVRVDVENQLLMVAGAVPGYSGAEVIVRPAYKKG